VASSRRSRLPKEDRDPVDRWRAARHEESASHDTENVRQSISNLILSNAPAFGVGCDDKKFALID
jgi:hypothetical protein